MGKKTINSGTVTVTGLWPFPDGYSVWAGTCTVNDPATTGGTRPDPVKPDPGQTLTAEVVLKPVKLTFLDDDGQPVANEDVVATMDNDTGCNETQFALGTTDAQGVVRPRCRTASGRRQRTGTPSRSSMPADGSVTYPLDLPLGGG